MKKIITIILLFFWILFINSCNKQDNIDNKKIKNNWNHIEKIEKEIFYSIDIAFNDDKLLKEAKEKNDKKICDNIKKDSIKQDCLNSLLFEEIIKRWKIELCSKLEESYKNRCLLFFVENSKDKSIEKCNLLSNVNLKNECLDNYYFNSKSKNNCKKIQNIEMRDDCLKN